MKRRSRGVRARKTAWTIPENHPEPIFDRGSTKRVMAEVMGFEPTASTLRTYGSQRFNQALSEDLPGSGVSIPSGPLTSPPLPSR